MSAIHYDEEPARLIAAEPPGLRRAPVHFVSWFLRLSSLSRIIRSMISAHPESNKGAGCNSAARFGPALRIPLSRASR